jgi:hypothetical protein
MIIGQHRWYIVCSRWTYMPQMNFSKNSSRSQGRYQPSIFTIIDKNQIFSIYYTKFRVYLLFMTFNQKMESYKEEKNCIMERENVLFKSTAVDEYHLPQMYSLKVYFGCIFEIANFSHLKKFRWLFDCFYVENISFFKKSLLAFLKITSETCPSYFQMSKAFIHLLLCVESNPSARIYYPQKTLQTTDISTTLDILKAVSHSGM